MNAHGMLNTPIFYTKFAKRMYCISTWFDQMFRHVIFCVFIVQSFVQSDILVSPKIVSRYWKCSTSLFKVTVFSPVILSDIK